MYLSPFVCVPLSYKVSNTNSANSRITEETELKVISYVGVGLGGKMRKKEEEEEEEKKEGI